MNQPTLRTVLSMVLWVTLAACWTPQHGEQAWPEYALGQSRTVMSQPVPVGLALTREHEARNGPAPQPGDTVVYSIEVELPNRSYRRYLRLTVQQPEDPDRIEVRSATITQTPSDGEPRKTRFYSSVFAVQIELFDEHAQLIAESTADQALVALLARGFAASCRAYLASGGEFTTLEESLAVSLLDAPALFSICSLLQNDDTLYDLAFDLVDKSLVLTAVWNFGIHFSIEPRMHEAERIDRDPILGVEAFRFPLQLTVNGQPALRLAATVVDPTAPIGLSAGITRVDGFRPSDDRYRFRVSLVPGRAAGADRD